MRSASLAHHERQASGAQRDEAEPMTLRDVAVALRGKLKLLAVCLAAAGALAALYIAVTPFEYRAEMAILLDPRERVPVGMEAQSMPQNPDPALVESHMRLIRSMSVLRDVVENEKLLKDKDFIRKPGLISTLRALIVKPEDPVDFAAAILAKKITTKRAEKSYMVDVAVLGSSPEKAERLARALFVAYSDSRRKLQDSVSDQQIAWLDERARELYARLLRAEQKVRDFRQAGGFIVTDGKVVPEAQLRDANAALVAARGKRADVESRLDQVRAALRSGNPETLGEAQRSPVIEKLRAEHAALAREEASARNVLGPRHPSYLATETQMRALERQIAEELRRIAASVERELQSVRKAEASAEKLVTGLQTQTNDLGGRKSELEQLEREAATIRAAYEKAISNRENVRRDIVAAPVGYLADAPTAAPSPAQPRIVPAAIIALGGGFNLWAGIVLFQETRRRRGAATPSAGTLESAPIQHGGDPASRAAAPARVAEPAPQRSRPEAPFGAALPYMEWAMRRSARNLPAPQWPRAGSTLHYGETVDDLRRDLRRRFGDGPIAVAILSLGYFTGKSTFASALAASAEAAGERVVILDLDAEGDGAKGAGMREACSRRSLARRIGRGDADLYLIDAGALCECERALGEPAIMGLILIDEDENLEDLAQEIAENAIPAPIVAEIATPDLLMARRA